MPICLVDLPERVGERLDGAVGPGGKLGVQLYASLAGETLINVAAGEFRRGEPLTTDTPLPWMCVSKPVLVLVLARLCQDGLLSLDQPVASVIPEFGAHGKDQVTVDHLLTHTAVFEERAFKAWRMSRADALAFVYDWHLAAPAGAAAWYSNVATWLILSEVIQRISGRDYFDLAAEQLLGPLRMTRTTRYTGPGEVWPEYVMHQRMKTGALVPMPQTPRPQRWPGTEIWGPASELARPFECVVTGEYGLLSLSAEVIGQFLAPVRPRLRDGYFNDLKLTWGRGLCTDPVLFGAPANARVTGHVGHVTALVLADLDSGLVVAYLSNTATPEPLLASLQNQLVDDVFLALSDR